MILRLVLFFYIPDILSFFILTNVVFIFARLPLIFATLEVFLRRYFIEK